MRAEGPFLISLSTRNDQRDEALRLTRQILTDFVKQGPDEADVREAKTSIVQGFPMSASSNASIVGYLGAIGFYGLPLDYLDQYLSRIEAVTADDIRAAFRRHVQADRLVAITVGKSKS